MRFGFLGKPEEVTMRQTLIAFMTLGMAQMAVGDGYCYSTTANPYLMAGTKTDYITLPNKRLTKVANTKSEKCKPVMVWMMTKHGASWPTQGEMTRYFSRLEFIKDTVIHANGFGNLCPHDQELFRSWSPHIPDGVTGALHPTGATGLRDMAQRVKRAFPNLFKKPFSPENYVVQYGKKSWKITYDSANSFVKGLFPTPPVLEDYPTLEDLVEELQVCKAENNDPHMSLDGPVNIADIKPLIDSYERVKKRLGISLENSDIDSIFFACAQEKAWDPDHKSPWCTLLEPEDIKAQEYVDDVNYYYSTAYKDPFGKQSACPVVKDMLTRFRMYSEKPTGQHPKGIFFFGLGKHVNVVTTALGMMVENQYLGLKEMNPARKYRTSKFMGFQGNLIAVLNECSSSTRAVKKAYKVKFFLNEVLNSLGEVKLEKLLDEYKQYINDPSCNYDFCNANEIPMREQYRQKHPYPVGVDPNKNLPSDDKGSSSSSSSEKKKKAGGQKKSGHPWYWYIYGFPLMVVSTCFTSMIKPFSSSSHSFT